MIKAITYSSILIIILISTLVPAHAVAPYSVTCDDPIITYNQIKIPLHVTEGGQNVDCAIVEVLKAKLKIKIKLGKNTITDKYKEFPIVTPPTVNGETFIYLPNLNQDFELAPKTKVSISLEYDCSTLKFEVYKPKDCPTPVTTGCCQISITTPATTYQYCYSGYNISKDIFQDNCQDLADFFATLPTAPLQALGFSFSAQWSSDLACDYGSDIPTAITLASFTAEPDNGKITVIWETGDETDNLGFNIYRAEAVNGEYTKINDSLISSKVGTGLGTSYKFTDNTVKNRKAYYYKLEAVDVYGVKTLHGPQGATPRLIYAIFK